MQAEFSLTAIKTTTQSIARNVMVKSKQWAGRSVSWLKDTLRPVGAHIAQDRRVAAVAIVGTTFVGLQVGKLIGRFLGNRLLANQSLESRQNVEMVTMLAGAGLSVLALAKFVYLPFKAPAIVAISAITILACAIFTRVGEPREPILGVGN